MRAPYRGGCNPLLSTHAFNSSDVNGCFPGFTDTDADEGCAADCVSGFGLSLWLRAMSTTLLMIMDSSVGLTLRSPTHPITV